MNEIVNKLLLAWDKRISEMHFKKPGFTYMFMEHSRKTKKEYKSLKKQEIHDIFIETN